MEIRLRYSHFLFAFHSSVSRVSTLHLDNFEKNISGHIYKILIKKPPLAVYFNNHPGHSRLKNE